MRRRRMQASLRMTGGFVCHAQAQDAGFAQDDNFCFGVTWREKSVFTQNFRKTLRRQLFSEAAYAQLQETETTQMKKDGATADSGGGEHCVRLDKLQDAD